MIYLYFIKDYLPVYIYSTKNIIIAIQFTPKTTHLENTKQKSPRESK